MRPGRLWRCRMSFAGRPSTHAVGQKPPLNRLGWAAPKRSLLGAGECRDSRACRGTIGARDPRNPERGVLGETSVRPVVGFALALSLMAMTASAQPSSHSRARLAYTVRPLMNGDTLEAVSVELRFKGSPTGTTVLDLPKEWGRSEEHTSELQSRLHLVCRLLLEKKNYSNQTVRSGF